MHAGVEIAYAMLTDPSLSKILRTKWRIKFLKVPMGTGENKVPDYQELLTGLNMALWVRAGLHENAHPPLRDRLREALRGGSDRFGALSLGESTSLVNDFRLLRDEDGYSGKLLIRDGQRGNLSLPVWADHVSSTKTKWERYSLREYTIHEELPESAWIVIAPIK